MKGKNKRKKQATKERKNKPPNKRKNKTNERNHMSQMKGKTSPKLRTKQATKEGKNKPQINEITIPK